MPSENRGGSDVTLILPKKKLPFAPRVSRPHDPSATTSCRLKELQQAMRCTAGGYALDDEGENLTHEDSTPKR